MLLRTELPHEPLKRRIDVLDRTLLCGSCFTEHIGTWLEDSWVNVKRNPWGILFNPASIAQSLTRCYNKAENNWTLYQRNDKTYSFDHHSSICAKDNATLLLQIRQIEEDTRSYLDQTDHLLITLGTAWIYERNGQIVANCHKAPAEEFVRRRLSVEEIVTMWSPIVQRWHTIFTVSPIRHIGDGLHGNQISKATLLLAIDELQQRFPDQVEYLPTYELLMDDLRDYRFYAEDMVHPSPIAIQAVRELVTDTAFTPQLQQYLKEAEPLVKTLHHRPSDPDAPDYQALLNRTLEKQRQLFNKWNKQ